MELKTLAEPSAFRVHGSVRSADWPFPESTSKTYLAELLKRGTRPVKATAKSSAGLLVDGRFGGLAPGFLVGASEARSTHPVKTAGL